MILRDRARPLAGDPLGLTKEQREQSDVYQRYEQLYLSIADWTGRTSPRCAAPSPRVIDGEWSE